MHKHSSMGDKSIPPIKRILQRLKNTAKAHL